MLDEILTFLVAGVTWFIHLMSVHSEIQKKVQSELDGSTVQTFTVEQLDSLVYLDCVFRKVFRFAPPAAGKMLTLTLTLIYRLGGQN